MLRKLSVQLDIAYSDSHYSDVREWFHISLFIFLLSFFHENFCAIEWCVPLRNCAASLKCIFVVASVLLNLTTTLSFRGSWTWCRTQSKDLPNLKVCFTFCDCCISYSACYWCRLLYSAAEWFLLYYILCKLPVSEFLRKFFVDL